ncbi:hypothetical protein EX895_000410 [Sporisorium graminicola]|uniref:Uncharacterized protein n=1 Tax=Sporisorium graminicola TaxID=280036 RepID=A0A4U7L4P7_9BASI|nr:hypothetical protein EX895_000410 [Sporisorium graminicola]TKY90412.1 hypothetical protein EX895_000410 [Sporisorium graminicola]
MTPGPSFTVPSTSSAAAVEADPLALPFASSSATPDQDQTTSNEIATFSNDGAREVSTDSGSSNDGLRRAETSLAQPKHCARCGQLLDAGPSSQDRQPPLPRTPSSASISAPSPSSYAFAPDSIRSQHRLQPNQSLTSAINAAAAVALSRHLGPDESVLTDADGHAICFQCAAQLAGQASSPVQSESTPASLQATNVQQPPATPSNSSSSAIAPRILESTAPTLAPGASIPTNAPQMHLTISVDNMGAGGDATLAPSADDIHMQDPSSFPPLERAPIDSAVMSSASPLSVARSTSRGRIRFAAAPGQQHAAGHREASASSSISAALGRSGSFSRSLSYNGPESVSSSSAPVVVSFPPSIAATPAFEAAPVLASSQPAHPFASSASLPAHSSQSQQASATSQGSTSHSHVPAAADTITTGVRQRRPSSARRLSRPSSSSLGPTTTPLAAVGASGATAASASVAAALSNNDDNDPFGPGAVTRPRLSQLSTHVIADELYNSARQTRPPSLVSSSTSTSLATSCAQHAAGIDPSRSVRYHADPLSYSSSNLVPQTASAEKRRYDEAQGMDIDNDEEKVSMGLAAKLGDVRWFDPYEPDPLAELSRLRNPPKGRGCLYPGATFNGTQKSGRNSYDVTVRVVNVDLEASHLCGYLNIRGLTEDWPELTTYFDAEIIGDRYGFVTGKWGATEADDLKHWARFPPFRPLRSALSKPGLRFNHLNKPFVFMRWKEKFLVPDHRVRDINGASFAGFYYVCVELGESAGRPPAAAAGSQTRGRRDSNVSMASTTTGGHLSPAGSPNLSRPSAAAVGGSPSNSLTGTAVSGQQWYAARTQRRRELSLSAPSYPLASSNAQLAHAFHQEQQQRQQQSAFYDPIYHHHSPHDGMALPSGPGFWPASPTSPHMPLGGGGGGEDVFASMWPDMEVENGYDDVGALGKMSGFYFHENSEPYQQLSLHHTAESCSSSFEMR